MDTHLRILASDLVLNTAEKERIKTSLSTLERRLKLFFRDEIIEIFVFGSYNRGTILPRRVDDNSDIDVMVVFKNPYHYKPQTLLNKLKSFMTYYYSRSEIFQSHPTVVLELNHIKFELVPAIKNTWDYLIPAPSSNFIEWTYTNPNELNREINNSNSQNYYLLKPLIRIMKYWNRRNGGVYSSYELEKQLKSNQTFHNSLLSYLKRSVDNLSPYYLSSSYKRSKLIKLKRDLLEIEQLKNQGNVYLAKEKLKNIFPSI